MSSITSGLNYTWVNDKQVLVYKATSMSVHIMFEWSQHILESLNHWPGDKPIQIVFDLSHPKISVPYMLLTNRDIFNLGITDIGKLKVQQLFIQRGKLFGRLAVLLPGTHSGTVVRNNSRSSTPTIESRMFTDYADAIEWVSDVNSITHVFGPTRALNISRETLLAYKRQYELNLAAEPETKLGLIYQENTMLIEIVPNQPVIVGRQDFDVNVVGNDAYTVSRLHAQFMFLDSILHLKDLETTNGTYLNRTRVQPHDNTPVNVGDDIQFGSVGVRLEYI